MLNVVMLSVVAPLRLHACFHPFLAYFATAVDYSCKIGPSANDTNRLRL
jgi:hypothetical protein